MKLFEIKNLIIYIAEYLDIRSRCRFKCCNKKINNSITFNFPKITPVKLEKNTILKIGQIYYKSNKITYLWNGNTFLHIALFNYMSYMLLPSQFGCGFKFTILTPKITNKIERFNYGYIVETVSFKACGNIFILYNNTGTPLNVIIKYKYIKCRYQTKYKIGLVVLSWSNCL